VTDFEAIDKVAGQDGGARRNNKEDLVDDRKKQYED
jgi:hypothetical protein